MERRKGEKPYQPLSTVDLNPRQHSQDKWAPNTEGRKAWEVPDVPVPEPEDKESLKWDKLKAGQCGSNPRKWKWLLL